MSWFGDINEPLPNGYFVHALGKMPDFASVSKGDPSQNDYGGLSECIGKLSVEGPIVIGQYSHPLASFDPNPNEPYFAFDTRDGKHVDVANIGGIQSLVGHKVQLVEVQFFRSKEPEYLRQLRLNKAVMFGPPIIAIGIFAAYVIRRRRRTLLAAVNIYT
jgi:hypothetical protein